MRFSNWFIALLLLGAVAGAVGCEGARQSAGADPAATPEPARRQLQRRAMRASVWRFVYCVEDGTDAAPLTDLLHEIANAQPFGKRIEVVNCNELTTDTLGAGPLTIFGNRLPTGAGRLSIQRTDSGWSIADAPKVGMADVLFVPYLRNPWASQPTTAGFYLSTDLAALADRIRGEYDGNYDRIFWPNWAYELYQADGDRVYGTFADTSWRFDPAQEMRMTDPEKPVYDYLGLKIYAYDGEYREPDLKRAVSALRAVHRLCADLLSVGTLPYPEIRIYPNVERIGLRTGEMRPAQSAADKNLLHLVPSVLPYDDLIVDFDVWSAFLRQGGTATVPGDKIEWLIALLQMLKADELGPRIGEQLSVAGQLKDTGWLSRPTEHKSVLIERAMLRYRAWMAGSCGEVNGLEVMQAVLDGMADKLCDGNRRNPTGLFAERAVRVRSASVPTHKLAGMTFAHEGYRVHNGYGGEKIVPSLDSLAKLNVNALAIVPYTSMRDPNKATPFRIGLGAGGENDWAVTRSIREAQGRGWFVLLKPQIWVGRGSWPGDIELNTEEEWNKFFDYYTYWIVHYALLAEREQVGALCLGTEMVKTTLTHPEQWRRIIELVRSVYGGQLTYAANWGEEFEGLSFWKDLDAIGLNSYYPTSKAAEPTNAELLAGAREWMTMAAAVSRKYDRPLWLTEVGYRSVAQTWANPHAEPGDRPRDDAAQERAYRALATAAGETPELRGMFVWKWPSFLGRNSYGGASFTPGGKPAAGVLKDFYEKWR